MRKEKIIKKLINALVKTNREKRTFEAKLNLAYEFLSVEQIEAIEHFVHLLSKQYPCAYKGEEDDPTRTDN